MSAEPIDDGGAAFPRPSTLLPNGEPWTHSQTGMSLRDWFAGMASEADIEANTGGYVNPGEFWVSGARTRVQARYAYADAMIAARKGGTP